MQLQDRETGEITRESLVRILEIMHRLASPEAMPELLREIIEVGKVAIVAEAGALWLLDRGKGDLVMVTPAVDDPPRRQLREGLVGECAASREIINIADCRQAADITDGTLRLADIDIRSLLSIPIVGKEGDLLGVMQWLGAEPNQFDHHDEWIGPALAAEAAIAIQHSYMTDELLAHAILEKEVSVAREIQISTLPREMPELPGYDLHGLFLPTDHTGGDLYDVVKLDSGVFLLLGDATGHGFGPALSATQMQAMLRLAFRLDADLRNAYIHVNNQLAEDLPDDRFITAFMGFLDAGKHAVEFYSGGQGPILHYRHAERDADWYKPTNFPVGAMEIDDPGEPRRLSLRPGDILALISDGVYEYTADDGRQFGEDRVLDVIREYGERPMADLADRIVEAARGFGGDAPQLDDITLVLVRRQPTNGT